MNNRVTITFSRDFEAGDSIGVYYSDPSTQTSGYWTFTWVNGTAGTFQVQVGTPTTTTGEIEAIRFASAWTNSLNGFTVTQPVGGNDNQVQITSRTYHFVNVLAKFANGSTMAIPADYNYVLSASITGNKITYEEKFPLNTPTADSKYLWKSVNANEVKTKFNLNDDRIGDLETDKADLVGGNDFIGNQTIDGNVAIGTTTASGILDIEKETGVDIYINSSSGDGKFIFQDASENKWHVGRDNTNQNFAFSPDGLGTNDTLSLTQTGNVGVGTNAPSEKLEVDGNIKSSGNVILVENSRVKLDVDVDDTSYILHDGTNVYASANDHKFIQGSNGNYAEVHTGNLYEHFTITYLTSSYNLTDSTRFLLYDLSSNGTLTIPTGLGVNSQEWKIVNASSSNTLTVSAASGVTLNYINNDSNNGVISQEKSAILVRYEDDSYYLIK